MTQRAPCRSILGIPGIPGIPGHSGAFGAFRDSLANELQFSAVLLTRSFHWAAYSARLNCEADLDSPYSLTYTATLSTS